MRVLRAGDGLVEVAAQEFERLLGEALRHRPRVSLALSGGRTPWPVLRRLAHAELDWSRIEVYQVDERVAPAGDPDRNLTGLRRALLDHVPAVVHPMPVEAANLEEAAARYAAELPQALDLVHLGLGDDGHTASLVPEDPVLDLRDRQVAITGPYRGHRRMTLTYPALEQAGSILWLVSGAGKAPMIERLVAGDASIPAGRVPQTHATLLTDGAAPP